MSMRTPASATGTVAICPPTTSQVPVPGLCGRLPDTCNGNGGDDRPLERAGHQQADADADAAEVGDKEEGALDDRANQYDDGLAGSSGQTGNAEDPLEVYRQRHEHQSGKNRGDAGQRHSELGPLGEIRHEPAVRPPSHPRRQGMPRCDSRWTRSGAWVMNASTRTPQILARHPSTRRCPSASTPGSSAQPGSCSSRSSPPRRSVFGTHIATTPPPPGVWLRGAAAGRGRSRSPRS